MRWNALVAAVMLALAVTTPSQASETQAFGSNGDAPYNDACESGRYMTGVRFRSGGWMDQITVVCSRLESDGTLVDPRPLTPRGGEGGGGPYEKSCPPGSVIRTLNVSTNDMVVVAALKFTCRSTKAALYNFFKVGNEAYFANLESLPRVRSCPPGEAATGLHGGYGRHVGSAGLICGPLIIPAPRFRPVGSLGVHRTPPPSAMAVARDDVDVYDGPGGQYKIIGMMEQDKSGTIITVVEGWCLLGGVGPAGGQGWVASDHLKGCGK